MTTGNPSQPRYRKRPHGMSRWFIRMPITFYRLRLGWLFGHRFLLLNHTGRKSGASRQTVLEVLRWDDAAHTPTVVSGFGSKSDWYLNVRHNPKVNIHIGREQFDAEAVELSPEEAAVEFIDYARRHPGAMKALAKTLDYPWDGSEASCREMAKLLPVLKFRPTKS